MEKYNQGCAQRPNDQQVHSTFYFGQPDWSKRLTTEPYAEKTLEQEGLGGGI